MSEASGSRLATLDVVRGFAVMGILLANVPFFGQPMLAEIAGLATTRLEGADGWAKAWLDTLVSGKFRGMLAILFGAGLWLQSERLTATGQWPGVYVRRTVFLGLLGILHAVLVWYGDILFSYAVAALVAMWLARLPEKDLKLWIVLMLGMAAMVGVGAAVVMGQGNSLESMGLSADDPIARILSPETETEVFAQGPVWMQFLYRLGMFAVVALQLPLTVAPLIGLFLIGVWLARVGFFVSPRSHPALRAKMLGWGLGLGLPLNALALAGHAWGWRFEVSVLIELFLSVPLAVGYLAVLASLAEVAGNLLKAVANVGRMALTCYLAQSVVCTAYFYSWGLGRFGSHSYLELLAMVPVVWAFNLVLASVWLRFFSIGPVEWAWRSVSARHALPWRRAEATPG
jgi:uncharacterized protein